MDLRKNFSRKTMHIQILLSDYVRKCSNPMKNSKADFFTQAYRREIDAIPTNSK